MLNAKDYENVVKSGQTANILVQDLRELVSSDDPLLSDIALELVEQAAKIEQRLKRIGSVTRSPKEPT